MGGIEIAAALLGVMNVLVVRRSTWNYPFGIAILGPGYAIDALNRQNGLEWPQSDRSESH